MEISLRPVGNRGQGYCVLKWGFTQTFPGNQDATLKYRVSHQYGNTFNFYFVILYQCYCKSKTSSEKLRSKPSRGHLDFDFFQKIRLFFRVGKKRNKTEFFLAPFRPHPLFFKTSKDFVFSDSCTRVAKCQKFFCFLLFFPHPKK